MKAASLRALATACFSLAVICVVAVAVNAKEKPRNWQTGKVVDTNRDSTYAGSVGNATGNSTTSGNTTYSRANASSVPVYRVYQTYEIDSGDYVYVCEEHLRWKWSKPAMLTVNGPVQFAIEKDRLYLKSEDGSKHETKIIKKILKQK